MALDEECWISATSGILDNLPNFQDKFGTKLREKVKMRYLVRGCLFS